MREIISLNLYLDLDKIVVEIVVIETYQSHSLLLPLFLWNLPKNVQFLWSSQLLNYINLSINLNNNSPLNKEELLLIPLDTWLNISLVHLHNFQTLKIASPIKYLHR